MIHIEFIEEHSLIRFIVNYRSKVDGKEINNANEDSRAVKENQLLHRNLSRAGCNTLNHSFLFVKPDGISHYFSEDYCFSVEAKFFCSFEDLIEKALKGFTAYSHNQSSEDFLYLAGEYFDLDKTKRLLEQYYLTRPPLEKNEVCHTRAANKNLFFSKPLIRELHDGNKNNYCNLM